MTRTRTPMCPPATSDPTAPRRPRQSAWLVGLLVGSSIALPALLILGVVRSFGPGDDTRLLRQAMIRPGKNVAFPGAGLRIGPMPLSLVRLGLRAAPLEPEARRIIAAVREIEAGWYLVGTDATGEEVEGMLIRADQALQPRGWHRAVTVRHEETCVAVFANEDGGPADTVRLCALVLQDGHAFVGGARVRPEPLLELLHQLPGRQRWSQEREGRPVAPGLALAGGR